MKGFPKGGLGIVVSDSMVAASTTEPEPRGVLLAGAYALVGMVGLLTLVGAFVALATLRGGAGDQEHPSVSPTAPRPARADDIGRSVPTSFGVVAVQTVKKLTGLTAKQLSGVTHYPSYFGPDRMQVQVSLQLTNLKKYPVTYAPRQFVLVHPRGLEIPLSGTTLPGGTLQPSASIEGQVTFVAPRRKSDRAHLWLEFRDVGTKKPIRLDIGSAQSRGPTGGGNTNHAQGH